MRQNEFGVGIFAYSGLVFFFVGWAISTNDCML